MNFVFIHLFRIEAGFTKHVAVLIHCFMIEKGHIPWLNNFCEKGKQHVEGWVKIVCDSIILMILNGHLPLFDSRFIIDLTLVSYTYYRNYTHRYSSYNFYLNLFPVDW